MQKVKKLAKIAAVAAVLFGATAPASAEFTSFCDLENLSGELRLIQEWICR